MYIGAKKSLKLKESDPQPALVFYCNVSSFHKFSSLKQYKYIISVSLIGESGHVIAESHA